MKFEDLKPANDNCNFNVDVLQKVMLDVFKPFFKNKTLFLALSGAKGFGKTFFICLVAWFYTCNFKDYNCLLARYTFISARTSYSSMMVRVARFLKDYGVNIIDKIESKEIKAYNSESKCEWLFNNGRVIKVIGFDNTSHWEGVAPKVGEWGFFGLDEVIPLREKIKDENDYIYQLNNMLIQIIRGKNLTYSFENFDELKFQDFQIYKKPIVIFGFNNHDTSHPIYQLYVQAISPLSDERKKDLKENGFSFNVNPKFFGLGATVIRGTTKLNEANLNDNLKIFAEGVKVENPEIYETLFMGGENELSIDQYSYRKDLYEGAQFFNVEEFYFVKEKRYWFNAITIGCDYADGGQLGDDAVVIMLGFEFDKEGYVEQIYVLEEESINTRRFKNMVEKVKHISKKISDWSKKYMHQDKQFFENSIAFKIGQDSRTVKDFISSFLMNDFDFDKKVLESGMSIFKSTGNNGWPIPDRHLKIKRLLAEQKIYFSSNLQVTKIFNEQEVVVKKFGHLYHELERCLNHPDKFIRDERPKANNLDAINAFEHALSFFRYRLFKS